MSNVSKDEALTFVRHQVATRFPTTSPIELIDYWLSALGLRVVFEEVATAEKHEISVRLDRKTAQVLVRAANP